MNLPNTITLTRTILIVPFIVLLYASFPYHEWVSAGFFLILALMDGLDGYLARKNNQVTDFGKFLDPLSDKLLVISPLILFIGKGAVAWMVLLIIIREISVTGLRILAMNKNIVIDAAPIGKLKTVSQMIAVVAVILGLAHASWFLLIATLFTLISGIDYFLAGRRILKE